MYISGESAMKTVGKWSAERRRLLVKRLRKIADEEAHAGLAAEFRKRADMIEAGLDPRDADSRRG
jgi:hypothetical protein